jgi:hypothetical protein
MGGFRQKISVAGDFPGRFAPTIKILCHAGWEYPVTLDGHRCHTRREYVALLFIVYVFI